ncbi:MAG: PKD domain-containing protein [Candidatus Peregrinibacteria bacterium]
MSDLEEKNVFLKSLEEETTPIPTKEQTPPQAAVSKGMSGTAIFASLFIFFLFLIVLLIFVLSVSGENSPVLQSFGVAGQDVKDFLTNVVNKTFMSLSIFLVLLFSIGIFRGFSLPSDGTPARRNSFVFGAVCGGLIFLVILAWIGSFAFIDRFAVASGTIRAGIEVTNLDPNKEIIAPLDIHFSAKAIVKALASQKKYPEGFQWSKDEGQTFTTTSLDDEITFAFETKGKKEVVLKVIFKSGEETFSLPFTVDDASFSLSPMTGSAPFTTNFDASALSKGKSYKSFEWNMDNDDSYEIKKTVPSVSYTFERAGEYPVSLRIAFQDGSVQIFHRTVTVNTPEGKPLVSVITATPDTKGIAPFSVTLSAENSTSKDGKIVDYQWVIGDKKEKKNGVSIQQTFTKAGKYPVLLTVTNDIGKTDTQAIEIEVTNSSHAPTAAVKTTPALQTGKLITGITPLEVKFDASSSIDQDNDIIKYEWLLNDEEVPFATGDKTSYTFRDKGENTVKLRITDATDNVSEEVVTVSVVNPNIIASIKTDPENGSAPLIVNFDGSESSCKKDNCKVISFEWDFGDGSPKQTTGAHTSHRYATVGTYTPTLTITTNTGETAKNQTQIAAVEPPFVACFDASRTTGPSPLSVTFNPSDCSQGTIKAYKWDFGDGVISEQRKPTHTFLKSGVYTVVLTIFDQNNSVSTDQKTITVE